MSIHREKRDRCDMKRLLDGKMKIKHLILLGSLLFPLLFMEWRSVRAPFPYIYVEQLGFGMSILTFIIFWSNSLMILNHVDTKGFDTVESVTWLVYVGLVSFIFSEVVIAFTHYIRCIIWGKWWLVVGILSFSLMNMMRCGMNLEWKRYDGNKLLFRVFFLLYIVFLLTGRVTRSMNLGLGLLVVSLRFILLSGITLNLFARGEKRPLDIKQKVLFFFGSIILSTLFVTMICSNIYVKKFLMSIVNRAMELLI